MKFRNDLKGYELPLSDIMEKFRPGIICGFAEMYQQTNSRERFHSSIKAHLFFKWPIQLRTLSTCELILCSINTGLSLIYTYQNVIFAMNL